MNARLRVEGMTDEEAKQLPVVIDTHMLKSARLTTWQTDFGPLDVLAGLESQKVPFKDFEFLETNASTIQGDGFLLRTAALTDIIEAKEFANRPKDQEALPELRRLRDAT